MKAQSPEASGKCSTAVVSGGIKRNARDITIDSVKKVITLITFEWIVRESLLHFFFIVKTLTLLADLSI